MTANWDWIGYKSKAKIEEPVDDDGFRKVPGARYVTGHYGEAHMDQFSGCGPSDVKYSFKAILRDGIVYIPDPDDPRDWHSETTLRFWVPAPVQPPTESLREVPPA